MNQLLPRFEWNLHATAQGLGVRLLTCDTDFARGRDLALAAPASEPWHGFELHPASRVG